MTYNNSFNFFIKTAGKELPINIFQFSKRIECTYKILEYSNKTKYIDIDLKLAMKHFFFQAQVDYINTIFSKKNITTQDLGFFTNMLVMKGLTSASAVDMLNVENGKFEKVQSTFFADKKVCGIIGSQYLSPLTSFIFTEDWNLLTNVLKYEKIINFDKNFLLQLNNDVDVDVIATSIWEKKLYSDNYNDYNCFLSSFKQLLESQYWVHNFGDFKLYKSPKSFSFYPEIYQILHNIDFNFNDNLNKYEIKFDSIFFDKSLIENENLTVYKTFDSFKEKLIEWRDKGEILEFKKSFCFLLFLNQKFLIEDYSEEDLKNSFKKVISNSKDQDFVCALVLINHYNVDKLKLKTFLIKQKLQFFYFIPYTESVDKQSNLLFISFKKTLTSSLKDIFKDCTIIFNNNDILFFLVKQIRWESTDLYNHYLWWDSKNQFLISSFLDYICGGAIFLLPSTWN